MANGTSLLFKVARRHCWRITSVRRAYHGRMTSRGPKSMKLPRIIEDPRAQPSRTSMRRVWPLFEAICRRWTKKSWSIEWIGWWRRIRLMMREWSLESGRSLPISTPAKFNSRKLVWCVRPREKLKLRWESNNASPVLSNRKRAAHVVACSARSWERLVVWLATWWMCKTKVAISDACDFNEQPALFKNQSSGDTSIYCCSILSLLEV